jgi:hypothetical protein
MQVMTRNRIESTALTSNASSVLLKYIFVGIAGRHLLQHNHVIA